MHIFFFSDLFFDKLKHSNCFAVANEIKKNFHGALAVQLYNVSHVVK